MMALLVYHHRRIAACVLDEADVNARFRRCQFARRSTAWSACEVEPSNLPNIDISNDAA